jgi:hypothetical protein
MIIGPLAVPQVRQSRSMTHWSGTLSMHNKAVWFGRHMPVLGGMTGGQRSPVAPVCSSVCLVPLPAHWMCRMYHALALALQPGLTRRAYV